MHRHFASVLQVDRRRRRLQLVHRESVRLLFNAIWDMAVERKYPASEAADRQSAEGAAHFLVHAIEHP